MPNDPHHRPRLQPTPPPPASFGREDSVDEGTARSVPPESPRVTRWAWGVVGIISVGLLVAAAITIQGDGRDVSVASNGAAPVATPTPPVLETIELFPLRDPARFVDQRVNLEGLQVTEVLDGRFAHVRPADHPDHIPALVDLHGVTPVDIRVGALIGLRGTLRAPATIDRAGLTEAQRARLDAAPAVIDAEKLVAPAPH